MNIPCDNPCIRCAPGIGGGIGPIDPDFPFVNLSSEDQDAIEYIGQNWFHDDPPLDSTWTTAGCMGLCISTVSQQAADLCALNQAQTCVYVDPKFPCNPATDAGCLPTLPELPRQLFNSTSQSCTINCSDGTPFTFIVVAGLFVGTTQAAANAEAESYACQQVNNNFVCLGTLTPARTCSNALYSGSMVCTSARVPITFTIIGDLPDGILLTQNDTTAFFNGTPTIPGDYVWTVVGTDQFGNTMQKLTTLTIFGVATVALPDGVVGELYAATLVSGGTPAGTVVWSITAGTLPDGLSLNSSTGEITGVPTTEETQTLQVTVTDGTLTCHRSLGIQVTEPVSCPDWNLLLWGSPTLNEVGAGIANFTPDSAQSNIGLGSMSANNPGDTAEIITSATIFYNGTGCSCAVDIDIQSIGIVGAGSLDIQSDIAGLLITKNWNLLGVGNHHVPFAIPDTGGFNSTLTVSWASQKDGNTTPGVMQIQIVISNE